MDIENPRGYFRSRARADGGLVTYPGEAVFAFSASRRGYATSPIVIRDGANAAPVADAGEPQELECTEGGAMATLDGSGSTDPDGASDIVSYSWSEDSSVFAEGVTVQVAVVADTSRLAFPMTAEFGDLFATGDADGARGEVVHEVLLLDDCVLYDGNSHGDGDGLLLDEIVVLDHAALCDAARRCGTTSWQDPAFVARATDCGGNSGAAGFVLPGHFSLVEGVCPED